MIGRWYASLAAFDLDITYVSGKSQLVADPLGRLFKEVKDGSYNPDTNLFMKSADASAPSAHLSSLTTIAPTAAPT